MFNNLAIRHKPSALARSYCGQGPDLTKGSRRADDTGPPVVVGEKPTSAALADQRLKGIQREF